MGFAPVPAQKRAAWFRRRVLTIRLESKEHNEPGTRPGKGWVPELFILPSSEGTSSPLKSLFSGSGTVYCSIWARTRYRSDEEEGKQRALVGR